MKHSRIVVSLALGVGMLLLGGCNTLGDRAFWYPQGPGSRQAEPAQGEARSAQRPDSPPRRRIEAAPQPVESPFRAAQAGAAPRIAQQQALPAAGGYTQATRYGDLVFISGQIAIDLRSNAFNESESVEKQTRVVMDNIRQILEEHRLTMANIVSVTVYMRALNDFRAMDAVYESYFRSNLPARSVVEVARLPRNAAVEISVIAGR